MEENKESKTISFIKANIKKRKGIIMSKFFNDTMQGLLEAIEIKKGNLDIKERKGMAAPTFYIANNDGIKPKCLNNSFSTWDELEKQLFTPEEIAESKVRVAIINEMIKAREEDGITQKQLEAMSGIKQPVISRMEKGNTDPQLSTVLKILNSLGKTLQIVPMK